MPSHGRHIAKVFAAFVSILGLACAQPYQQNDLHAQYESSQKSANTGFVVWCVLLVVFVTVFLASIITALWCRRKRAQMTSTAVIQYGNMENQHAITIGTPVPAAAYPAPASVPIPPSPFLQAHINYPVQANQPTYPEIPLATKA